MRLYHSTQVSQSMHLRNRGAPLSWISDLHGYVPCAGLYLCVSERHHCWMVAPCQVTESPQQEDGDLIQPRKLPNPIRASRQHRALHQELLFCQRRGLLPRKRPELQSVLENRQREQQKQSELALVPPSDLEVKLCTRQQRIHAYEQEEKKRSESLQNVPEFVRVRGALKHIQTFS